jgi:hypothetical protein
MMRHAKLPALFLMAWMLLGGTAAAHTTGTSYLRIDAGSNATQFAATWDVAANDLQWALDLDADGDAAVSTLEMQNRRAAIVKLVTSQLMVRRNVTPCTLEVGTLSLESRDSQPMVRLPLRGQCSFPGPLYIATSLFFGSPTYTALLDVQTQHASIQTLLSPSQPNWTEQPLPSFGATLALFLQQGLWHVLIGYDHIAFLLLLLLPSVLRATRDGWTPNSSRHEILRDLVKVVTAFTVAHSVTLALAATHFVRPATQSIEVAIAASIVLAGLLNLWPRAAALRLALAFGFGLVHGFGFANALAEIGAQGVALAPMLAGFNLGVEAAQLLIVAATLPILFMLRARPTYAHRVLPIGSVSIAIAGVFWMVERLSGWG